MIEKYLNAVIINNCWM